MFNLKQPQGFLDADSSLTIMNLNFGPAAAKHILDARQVAKANEPAIGAVGVQRLNPTQVGSELMGKNSTGNAWTLPAKLLFIHTDTDTVEMRSLVSGRLLYEKVRRSKSWLMVSLSPAVTLDKKILKMVEVRMTVRDEVNRATNEMVVWVVSARSREIDTQSLDDLYEDFVTLKWLEAENQTVPLCTESVYPDNSIGVQMIKFDLKGMRPDFSLAPRERMVAAIGVLFTW